MGLICSAQENKKIKFSNVTGVDVQANVCVDIVSRTELENVLLVTLHISLGQKLDPLDFGIVLDIFLLVEKVEKKKSQACF